MVDDPLLDSDDPAIFDFIRTYAGADVKALGLKAMPDRSWPRTSILDQIAARQKTAAKMPAWLAYDRLVLPPCDVIEQASSPATARYKAGLVNGGESFADLTAGAGMDATALTPHFRRGICIEADALTARRLQHNLTCFFGDTAPFVRHCTAEEALNDLPSCQFITIDPQRRNGNRRVIGFESARPDVATLLPALLTKAEHVLIKASPMLDIAAACDQLHHVAAVHIVEYAGAVRELLFDCRRRAPVDDSISCHAVVIDDDGAVLYGLDANRAGDAAAPIYGKPARYLYEPAPAVMKSRLFATLTARHDLFKLAPATHLFTADHYDDRFPGHIYEIRDILPVDRKALQRAGITGANLKCRNFPDTPEHLRKRLRLSDGGDDTLFACQLANGGYKLIYTRRKRQ